MGWGQASPGKSGLLLFEDAVKVASCYMAIRLNALNPDTTFIEKPWTTKQTNVWLCDELTR